MTFESGSRRHFMRRTALGGLMAAGVPTFLARTRRALGAEADRRGVAPVTGKDGTILVVLQLAGGNDGLNTVVPFDNDHYRRARPRLGLARREVLPLDDALGFHPSLAPLMAVRDAGQMAIVQGVGYPNPNRSHFRSMEIWQTGSDAERYVREGWLGRYFDQACRGAEPTVGVNVGRQVPQAFTSKRPTGVSVSAPVRVTGANRRGEMGMRGGGVGWSEAAGLTMDESGGTVDGLGGSSGATGGVLEFLDRTAFDAETSARAVGEVLSRAGGGPEYPNDGLGQSLRTVARLIAGGLSTRVYYVSQGGFDTHTQQASTHARLLSELASAVAVFLEDLKAQGNLARVLVMTFSEFGRRVAENASGGTDHGAAGPVFLFGPGFTAGQFGTYPSLDPQALVKGDLAFGVDFRRIYASVLEQWLQTSSEGVLGRRFEALPLI